MLETFSAEELTYGVCFCYSQIYNVSFTLISDQNVQQDFEAVQLLNLQFTWKASTNDT